MPKCYPVNMPWIANICLNITAKALLSDTCVDFLRLLNVAYALHMRLIGGVFSVNGGLQVPSPALGGKACRGG
jgi:hypothetical protein